MAPEPDEKSLTLDVLPQGRPRMRALDGLRAIAISAVLLYHGGAGWALGGLLGVDLFFVLSGFLITSLLLDEHRRNGQIDLRAFWAARARRLLPALGLVLVTVLWILPAFGVRWAERVAADAWSAAFYYSNWRFIFSGQGYTDQADGPSPLLHTWSLSIEEQWYLVLPLILLLVLRLRRSNIVLQLVLSVATICSAALCFLLYAPGNVNRSYFGTDSRIQALLIGALLATLATTEFWRLASTKKMFNVLAPVGLIALLWLMAVATPQSEWLYRGGFLVVALCAAAAIAGAASGQDGGSTFYRALSIGPLVWLGAISYGVYLWHWPVFLVLDNERMGFGGPGLFLVRVAVTLALATVSFVLVERPVRSRVWRQWEGRSWKAPPLLAAGIAIVLAALMFPASAAPVSADSLAGLEKMVKSAKPRATTDPKPNSSSQKREGDVHSIVLVGDSQAVSLFAAVRDNPGDGLTVLVASRLGCGVVPFTATAKGVVLQPQAPLCDEWAQQREGEIASAHADLGVLFAGTWEQYDRYVDGKVVGYKTAEWRKLTAEAYRTVLDEMSRHVTHLAIALDHCHKAPDLDLPVETLYQVGRYPPVVNDPARISAVNQAIRDAASDFPNVTVLDVGSRVCPRGFTEKVDGVTMRTDGVHWTTEGGQLVWKWMRPKLLAGANN